MANRFYSVQIGGGMKTDVTETTSTTASAPFELRVSYDATGGSKVAVLKALEALRQRLTEGKWPPV